MNKKATICSSSYSDETVADQELQGNLKRFLKKGGIFALILEFYVACHAEEFLGYQTGPFEGGASMPTLVVNQLRLHQCGTKNGMGLFAVVKEYIKRYS